MFLSHLNCFISGIALLLFIIRYKKHSYSENLLFTFAGLTFISSTLWLYVNYYNNTINQVVDYFGIISENTLLTICILYLYFLDKKKNRFRQNIANIGLIVIVFLLFIIHFFISDTNTLILHPSNKNVFYNIVFQICIDCFIFSVFIYRIYSKKFYPEKELFDGNFKKYVTLAFSFYFIQDIFILCLFLIAIKGIVLPQILMNITLLLNTIISLFIVMAAIYTNWLKEYNQLRSKQSIKKENTEKFLSLNDLKDLKKIDWNEIQYKFKNSHYDIILKIETNTLLSPTEKIYAFLDHFNFSNRDLSEILFVSIRTVETNFYRMRRKVKENNS